MRQTAWLHTSIVPRAWVMIQLVRPLNVIMILIGVVVGGVMVGGASALLGANVQRLVLAALSAALIGAAGNSLNDVLDLGIDRVNRPERPLPSGRLSAGGARMLWMLGSAVGVIVAALLSTAHLTLALVAVGGLLIYNARLKRVPVAGNVMVAGLVGLTLVYGGWAVGSPAPALVGAGFAFLTTWVRELIKDLEDVAGDAMAGARTLPLIAGEKVARRVAVGLLALTLFLAPVPYLAFRYTGLFLVLMLFTVALMLRAIWVLLAPAHSLRAASTTLKAVMLAGMAALACDALVQVTV